MRFICLKKKIPGCGQDAGFGFDGKVDVIARVVQWKNQSRLSVHSAGAQTPDDCSGRSSGCNLQVAVQLVKLQTLSNKKIQLDDNLLL